MNIKELTKGERLDLAHEIIKLDNLPIATIVALKEQAINEKLEELQEDYSGLAFRASSVFGDAKQRKQVKPLLAKDLLKSNVFKGTKFEEELKPL